MKVAKETVNRFFTATNQPDQRYYLKLFSEYTIKRIGEEVLISYISKMKQRYGALVERDDPIHEDIQIINKGGKESVLINLKYKVIYQLGELIENILVIDQPWGILVYNITAEQKLITNNNT